MKTLYLLKYRKTSRYFVYLVCLVIFAISFIASKTPFPVVAQAAWMCHLCDVRVCKPIRSVRSVVVNASISIKKIKKKKIGTPFISSFFRNSNNSLRDSSILSTSLLSTTYTSPYRRKIEQYKHTNKQTCVCTHAELSFIFIIFVLYNRALKILATIKTKLNLHEVSPPMFKLMQLVSS